jgi:transposase
VLKAEIQAEILARYFGDKKSARAISKEMGINRKSVAGVINRRSVTFCPTPRKTKSILEPFYEKIAELLEKDPWISASTIHHRIRTFGYMGGVSIVRDYAAKTRKIPLKKREAFLKLEFAPGDCAQVDWGEFGDVFGDGVKIHCFVMVLCYSRLLYLEFTRSERFEDFVRCHENGFQYFSNRVPRECWYDNLATAVTDRMGSLVRFNERFFAYLSHHHIRPHACNPARGNEKGRVEDGVKYIRSSFWAGRHFKDFETLTYQASLWRDQIANQREHRSNHKIPKLLFESVEKQHLMEMNPHPFDTDEVIARVVPPQCHIPYETNQYSVPWTLVGLTVTLRISALDLRMYYKTQLVARHERSYLKSKTYTNPGHLQGLLERKPGGKNQPWQIQAVNAIGPELSKYVELVKSGSRSLRGELSQLLALATVYGEQAVNAAVKECLSLSIIGVDQVEKILTTKKRQNDDETLNPKPIVFKNEKLNRVVPTANLEKYDEASRRPYLASESGAVTRTDDDFKNTVAQTIVPKAKGE